MPEPDTRTLVSTEDRSIDAPRRPARDPFWDNVRWVAIALVVVGHTIELPSRNDLAYGLYLTIYMFHMPLFALVCGRFAHERFDRQEGANLVRQLIAPYLVFQVVWALINLAFLGRFTLNLLYPAWLLWFLVALAIWRLTLPIFAALRFPIATAVVISCLGGTWGGLVNLLAVPRTMTFLPFFVAGWALHRRGVFARALPVLRRAPVRAVCAGVLALVVVASVVGADRARGWELRALFQGQLPFAELDYTQWWAPGVRLAGLAVSTVLIGCVLALVPRVDGPMARAGRRTMTVYLLHLLPIAVLQRLDLFPDRLGNAGVLLLLVIGLVWTVVLSTPLVHKLASPLVSPPVDALIDRELRVRRRQS